MSVRVPKYRLHKGSGQALVQVNGHRIYLGKYGSEVSREKYRRTVAEWLTNGGSPASTTDAATPPGVTGDVLVNQLILAYWQFAQVYYQKNGRQTGEAYNIKTALRPLRQLYGSTPASDFGPDALEVVQRSMIDGGLSRNVINGRVGRIKRMFRWASKKKLVPGETYYGLKSVEGLQRGRFNVRETSPVKPVPDEHVLAVLPKLNLVVQAMVQVQELAGMRPQDIRNMRTCDLDMTGDVWVYRPWTHKTEHRGHVQADCHRSSGPGDPSAVPQARQPHRVHV